MPGRLRLPGGEPRKASQKRTRRSQRLPTRINPPWRFGDRIFWQKKAGTFQRVIGDEIAEVLIAGRLYRVRLADLGPG